MSGTIRSSAAGKSSAPPRPMPAATSACSCRASTSTGFSAGARSASATRLFSTAPTSVISSVSCLHRSSSPGRRSLSLARCKGSPYSPPPPSKQGLAATRAGMSARPSACSLRTPSAPPPGSMTDCSAAVSLIRKCRRHSRRSSTRRSRVKTSSPPKVPPPPMASVPPSRPKSGSTRKTNCWPISTCSVSSDRSGVVAISSSRNGISRWTCRTSPSGSRRIPTATARKRRSIPKATSMSAGMPAICRTSPWSPRASPRKHASVRPAIPASFAATPRPLSRSA